MPYNINHGLGKLIAEAIATERPHSGKVFLVIPNTHENWAELTEMFPGTYPDGGVVIHSTLQAAIDASRNNADDVIYAADGHTETITAAAGITVNKTGLKIIGLGQGNRRPTINFTTAVGADLEIDNEGTWFENFIFDFTGIDALTGPIDVDAANTTFKNCEFITADADGQAVVGIVTDANAGGLKLLGCYFRGTKNAGNVSAVRIVGGENHVIRDSTFDGAYRIAAGAIEVSTTAAGVIIENTNIRNKTVLSTAAINVIRNSSLIVAGCVFGILSGTNPIQVEYSGTFVGNGSILTGRNYYRNTSTVAAGTLL